MDRTVKKLLYIFLLGLATYGFWKLTAEIKSELEGL